MVRSREEHPAVEVTWRVYQDVIAAHADPTPAEEEKRMHQLITRLRHGLPQALAEIAQFGRTLWRKQEQILAFFGRGGASTGPVEAINGRLEHLRGIALGFRNVIHYVQRYLIHSGQLAQRIDAL